MTQLRLSYWCLRLFLSAVGALLLPQSPLLAAEKPNIVFILADDLGIGDVKCYGGERCLIETPNIDALAADGLKFTDAHVNASICGPTRRAIMTGRYNWRFGPTVQSGPWGFVGPRPGTDRYTLGKMLRNAGYQTGYVGKWHLGTIMATKDGKTQGPSNVDYSKALLHGPTDFGFDESFILPGSLDMYPYAFVRNQHWQGEITAQKGWSAFHRVGPAERDFEDHEVLETFYCEAESFIDQCDPSHPFFLFLALTAPHTPTSPGVRWKGKSKLGVYGDFVMEVDHAVKRVRDALSAKGMLDDTLVLFSSDHGPGPYAGNILKATPGQIREMEALGHYSNGPHRGYKFSIYEGGLRVPLIASWPGHTPANTQSNALIGLCDLYATFAELTGQKLSDDEAPDSVSFANQLADPNDVGQRRSLVMESGVHFAIRDGDWKLCLTPACGIPVGSVHGVGNEPTPEVAWRKALDQFGARPADADLWKAPFVQLFHLPDDPHEDRNLAGRFPDRVARMGELLRSHVTRGRSTMGPDLKNDRKVRVVNVRDKRLPSFVTEPVE